MKRILSIDDEPAMLSCFSDALKSKGYDVVVTTDPEEGLRILREDQDLALVLLDVKMPGKSGFDIYREFKEFRDLPVLFVTAYPKSFAMDSDEVTAMWESQFVDGTTDILYKPFDLSVFFDKIEGLIGGGGD